MHFFDRLADLEKGRRTFAVATVVARWSPVSSHLGDRAVVHADGRMEGFVGGSCSRDLVRREALRAMRSGKPRLLQIRPDAGVEELPGGVDAERVTVPMGCASNGSVDVYIEPHLPPRAFVVVGYTPVAEALARLAAASQTYDVVRVVVDEEMRDLAPCEGVRIVAFARFAQFLGGLDPAARSRLIAVVASQGHYDESALGLLLSGPTAFVGLLASRKRAATVRGILAQQGIDGARIEHVRNPVGLAIGGRTAPEVAISILAEVVAEAPPAADDESIQVDVAGLFATDPVCGMDIEIASARFKTESGARAIFFCSASCASAYASDPDRYAIAVDAR